MGNNGTTIYFANDDNENLAEYAKFINNLTHTVPKESTCKII